MAALVVDETFWQTDSLHLWPPGGTIDSLNLRGPYPVMAGSSGRSGAASCKTDLPARLFGGSVREPCATASDVCGTTI